MNRNAQVVAMRGGCVLGPDCVSEVTASCLEESQFESIKQIKVQGLGPIDGLDFVVLGE